MRNSCQFDDPHRMKKEITKNEVKDIADDVFLDAAKHLKKLHDGDKLSCDNIAKLCGLSPNTVRKLINNPNSIKKSWDTKKADLYNFYMSIDVSEFRTKQTAYDFFLEKLFITNEMQSAYSKLYAGKYVFVRKSLEMYNFVWGVVEIQDHEHLGIPWFIHTSKQRINDEKNEYKVFNHSGFVFFANTRFFLFGIGENYIRPIIYQHFHNPKQSEIVGVMLSERELENAFIPFATRTMLLSYENERLKDFDFSGLEGSTGTPQLNDSLMQYFEEELENNSKRRDEFVYGSVIKK